MALRPIHRWDDIAGPRVAVQVLHGLAEHGGRYERLARALNAEGIVVWAHDHRGHGASPGVRGHFADSNGWRALIDDAWAVSEAMRGQFPGIPLVLFAHSMGSFVGQMLMAEHGDAYRGVVLSGTNGPPGSREAAVRVAARTQRAFFGPRRPGTWVDSLVLGSYNRQFAPNRTPADWLSRDTAEVDAYLADPLCGAPLTAQSWLDFLDGLPVLGTKAHLQRIPRTLPVHVLAGTADPVGEQSKGVQRLLDTYAKAGLSNVGSTLYPDARHELVNETNRDTVTRDLIAWIAAREDERGAGIGSREPGAGKCEG